VIRQKVEQEGAAPYVVEWLTKEEVIARFGFDPRDIDPRKLKTKLVPEGDRTVRYYLTDSCAALLAAKEKTP
jgi:hypothetical protein